MHGGLEVSCPLIVNMTLFVKISEVHNDIHDDI